MIRHVSDRPACVCNALWIRFYLSFDQMKPDHVEQDVSWNVCVSLLPHGYQLVPLLMPHGHISC